LDWRVVRVIRRIGVVSSVVIGALAIIAIVMFVSFRIVTWLSSQYSATETASYGQVGDIFGFAAAVFAGIGLLGVAAALMFETVDRKRARRPFVTALPKSSGVEIRRVEWSGGSVDVRVRVDLKLRNDSIDPGLNVIVEAPGLAALGDGTSVAVMAVPLGAGLESGLVLAGRLHGKTAETFLRDLGSGGVHNMILKARYESLNGAAWYTLVNVALSVRSVADRELLVSALASRNGLPIDGNTDDDYGPGSVPLESIAVQGSWKQGAS
jgi:uncharacterized membrane protein